MFGRKIDIFAICLGTSRCRWLGAALRRVVAPVALSSASEAYGASSYFNLRCSPRAQRAVMQRKLRRSIILHFRRSSR